MGTIEDRYGDGGGWTPTHSIFIPVRELNKAALLLSISNEHARAPTRSCSKG